MVGLVLGLTAGLVFVLGLTVGSTAGLVFVLVFVLPDVLVAGLVAGLTVALAFGLEAPVNAADVVTATESLARDRRSTIRKMLAFGPVAVLVFVLTFGFTNGLAFGFTGGLPVVVVVGFVGVRASSAWIYWLVLVRVWLPLTGRLPWRVQTFLTDAYQRGVLRQTGAVYQFRHARLQDHLTAELRLRSPQRMAESHELIAVAGAAKPFQSGRGTGRNGHNRNHAPSESHPAVCPGSHSPRSVPEIGYGDDLRGAR
jgi:hypothetical protein